MNISEAFKALGDQHLEEQNILGKGLSLGVSTVKDYIEGYKLKKFEAQVEKFGSLALLGSPYENNKEVVLKVLSNEKQFWDDTLTKIDYERNSLVEVLDPKILKRLSTYNPARNLNEPSNYISEKMMEDKDIALKVVYFNGETVSTLKEELRNDKDIARSALKSANPELCWFGDVVKKDAKLVRQFTLKNPANLQYAADEIKSDKSMAYSLVGQEDAFQYLSESLRHDKEVVLWALKPEYADTYPCRNSILEHTSPQIQAIAGTTQPRTNLKKALATEKFSNSLDSKLALKNETTTKKIKI
jgi:hypothetical protein